MVFTSKYDMVFTIKPWFLPFNFRGVPVKFPSEFPVLSLLQAKRPLPVEKWLMAVSPKRPERKISMYIICMIIYIYSYQMLSVSYIYIVIKCYQYHIYIYHYIYIYIRIYIYYIHTHNFRYHCPTYQIQKTTQEDFFGQRLKVGSIVERYLRLGTS